jgi:carbon monoxide dehydrogenase subunit G
MRLEVGEVFRAPPERVWAVLADWEGQAAWMPDVAWMRLLGPEREMGARLAVRTRVLGVPATTDLLLVTRWEPPRRLGVEHLGFVHGTGEWRLEPVAEGTRFTWVEELRLPFGMLGEIAIGVYGPVQRAMLRRSTRNLGAIVKGS